MHPVMGTAIFFKIQNLSPAKDQLYNICFLRRIDKDWLKGNANLNLDSIR